jgi:hypothetical protein
MPRVQNKERTQKAARNKHQATYKDKPIRMTAAFSAETLKIKKVCNNTSETLKINNFQQRLLYPAKLSFKNINGEIKSF